MTLYLLFVLPAVLVLIGAMTFDTMARERRRERGK